MPKEDNVKDSSKATDPVQKSKSESAPTEKINKLPTSIPANKTVPDDASKQDTTVKSQKPVVENAPPESTFKPVNDHDVAPMKVRDARSMLIKVTALTISLIAIVVLVFGVLIYGYRSENPAVKTVASILPYPVERINGHFVTYKDYLFELDANKRAYQNNAKLNNQPAVDFNSADGKKLVIQIKQHALDKLSSDALTAQLAAQKKVTVTDKEVTTLINQLYDRYGGKDTLLKTLNQIYGWNINDLRGVVYKQLLAKNLETKVTSDPAVDGAAKVKAQGVLSDIKAGTDFSELAKKNSQASDAASGGDLGFFTKGQLPDELQKAAEALQPGQVSDPIKDQYGYEIMKVIEKKDDGSIHAQHILIKTVDYTEYFQNELKKAKINKFIKV